MPCDEAAARAFLMERFRPYRAANNNEAKGLFTGYYEIELEGARTRSARYAVPIYGLPKDLVTADLSEFDSSLSGKQIIGRVVGFFALYMDGKTTEAGIRQLLGADARPVILDEVESEDMAARSEAWPHDFFFRTVTAISGSNTTSKK